MAKMTTAHKVQVGISVVLLIGLALLFSAWKQSHDAVLKAQGATEERQQLDKQVDQQRRDTQTQLQSITLTIDSLRSQLARTPVVTAPQIIHEQVPSLAQTQPTIITVPAQPATTTGPAVPAQQIAQLPLAQFEEAEKQFAGAILDRNECQAKLSACQSNVTSDADAYKALERERDAWEKAAGHGGGLVTRLWRKIDKYVYLGGGLYAGYKIGEHRR